MMKIGLIFRFDPEKFFLLYPAGEIETTTTTTIQKEENDETGFNIRTDSIDAECVKRSGKPCRHCYENYRRQYHIPIAGR